MNKIVARERKHKEQRLGQRCFFTCKCCVFNVRYSCFLDNAKKICYILFVSLRINVHTLAIVVFNLQEEFNQGLILTDAILSPNIINRIKINNLI